MARDEPLNLQSLSPDVVEAARAAAAASGLTLDEWLNRTILGIVGGFAAARNGGRRGDPPEGRWADPLSSISQNLKTAADAASAAGVSFEQWLSQAILSNTTFVARQGRSSEEPNLSLFRAPLAARPGPRVVPIRESVTVPIPLPSHAAPKAKPAEEPADKPIAWPPGAAPSAPIPELPSFPERPDRRPRADTAGRAGGDSRRGRGAGHGRLPAVAAVRSGFPRRSWRPPRGAPQFRGGGAEQDRGARRTQRRAAAHRAQDRTSARRPAGPRIHHRVAAPGADAPAAARRADDRAGTAPSRPPRTAATYPTCRPTWRPTAASRCATTRRFPTPCSTSASPRSSPTRARKSRPWRATPRRRRRPARRRSCRRWSATGARRASAATARG